MAVCGDLRADAVLAADCEGEGDPELAGEAELAGDCELSIDGVETGRLLSIAAAIVALSEAAKTWPFTTTVGVPLIPCACPAVDSASTSDAIDPFWTQVLNASLSSPTRAPIATRRAVVNAPSPSVPWFAHSQSWYAQNLL